jgi:hypothetical protein
VSVAATGVVVLGTDGTRALVPRLCSFRSFCSTYCILASSSRAGGQENTSASSVVDIPLQLHKRGARSCMRRTRSLLHLIFHEASWMHLSARHIAQW